MPTSRPMSPVRVVKNALRAASEFCFSSHQCPISTNEQRPMISQPSRSWRVFSATTRFSMPGGEQGEEGEVVGEADVALHVLERRRCARAARSMRDHEDQRHGEAVDVGADAEVDAARSATTSTTRPRARRRRGLSSARGHHRLADAAHEAEGAFAVPGVLAPAGSTGGRADGQHEGGADGRRCRSRPPCKRQALAEEQDEEERHRRDHGISQAC